MFWTRRNPKPPEAEADTATAEAKFRSHHRIAVEVDARRFGLPWSAWVERTYYHHGTWFEESKHFLADTEANATRLACEFMERKLQDVLVEANRKYVTCERPPQ